MSDDTKAPAEPPRATVPQAIGPNDREHDTPVAQQCEAALAQFHGAPDPAAPTDVINPEE